MCRVAFPRCQYAISKTLDMGFVDNGLIPRDTQSASFALPVESGIDDNAFGHERCAVTLVECGVVAGFHLVAENRGIPLEVSRMGACVRIE